MRARITSLAYLFIGAVLLTGMSGTEGCPWPPGDRDPVPFRIVLDATEFDAHVGAELHGRVVPAGGSWKDAVAEGISTVDDAGVGSLVFSDRRLLTDGSYRVDIYVEGDGDGVYTPPFGASPDPADPTAWPDPQWRITHEGGIAVGSELLDSVATPAGGRQAPDINLALAFSAPFADTDWTGEPNRSRLPSVTLPGTPTLAAPVHQAVDVSSSPTLAWSPSENALTYTVEAATDVGFADATPWETSDTQLLVGPLSDGTVYYWHVQATNSDGHSEWSETWTFQTSASVDKPSITVELDTDGPVSAGVDFVAWVRVDNVTDLQSWAVRVEYDHNQFELVKATGNATKDERSVLELDLNTAPEDMPVGALDYVAGVKAGNAITGSVSFLKMTFKPLDGGGGMVSVSKAELLGPGNVEILAEASGLAVAVE